MSFLFYFVQAFKPKSKIWLICNVTVPSWVLADFKVNWTVIYLQSHCIRNLEVKLHVFLIRDVVKNVAQFPAKVLIATFQVILTYFQGFVFDDIKEIMAACQIKSFFWRSEIISRYCLLWIIKAITTRFDRRWKILLIHFFQHKIMKWPRLSPYYF